MNIMKLICMICVLVIAAVLTGCAAQQKTQQYAVGLVQLAEHPSLDEIRTAFEQQLERLLPPGSYQYEYRNAQGDGSVVADICSKFVAQRVDVLVAIATPAAQGAAAAVRGTEIPVVFSAVTDPVAAGLVADLQRPDTNITGVSDAVAVDKIFELAARMTPQVKRYGLLYTPSEVNSASVVAQAKVYLTEKGLEYREGVVSTTAEVQAAVQGLLAHCDAIFVPVDNTVASAMSIVAQEAIAAGKPVYTAADSLVHDGGLATVGIQYTQLGQKTAELVQRVLTGTPVSELPVQMMRETTEVVNQQTAQALGLLDLPAQQDNKPQGGVFRRRGGAAALLTAIEQGLIYALAALGVYVSFRVLELADLTTDGAFTLGVAVSAVLTAQGHPLLALPAAAAAGALAGAVTALLQTKLGIQPILSGILTMTGLISINLMVMGGKSNQSLLRVDTLFTQVRRWLGNWGGLALAASATLLCAGALCWFLSTRLGMSLRAAGSNPAMVAASSVNPATMVLLGLCMANGLAALSGALLAQQQGYGDTGLGTGTVVLALASLVLGEAFTKRCRTLAGKIAAVVLGAVGYRMITAIALTSSLGASYLKLVSALIVAAAMAYPALAETLRARCRRAKSERRRPEC